MFFCALSDCKVEEEEEEPDLWKLLAGLADETEAHAGIEEIPDSEPANALERDMNRVYTFNFDVARNFEGYQEEDGDKFRQADNELAFMDVALPDFPNYDKASVLTHFSAAQST
jgi:hypothetical protein